MKIVIIFQIKYEQTFLDFVIGKSKICIGLTKKKFDFDNIIFNILQVLTMQIRDSIVADKSTFWNVGLQSGYA